MNKATRMLTMLGMGLMAGATIGAGPAVAADSSSAQAAKPAPTSTTNVQERGGRDRIVGYFRNLRDCERAGRIGEWNNRWEDYDCDRVRFGFKRGLWALEVEQDWRGGHGHFGGRDRDRDRDFGHHGGPRGPRDHGPRGPRGPR